MNKLTPEQKAKGRKLFLNGHLEVKQRIEALTQAGADALGITLEMHRESETMWALREVAHEARIDSAELFCSYIADTAEELAQMIAARDQAIKKAIGP